ncbi:MAG TPA: metal-dependent hydrolase [Cyclobacteriaceae bacterium]|nr:metal-dependent hydrolase [Cyclobacteriaceae bacterium]
MDSLTHIVLGVALGEVTGRRQIGKSAWVLGAVAQTIPDFDFFAFLWTTTTGDLIAHRGITHSFAFMLITSPWLAWMARRWRPALDYSFFHWLAFFGLQLTVHDFIDAFNAYGTGWFEPFSHTRISFHALFVADPLFTLGPLIGCVAIFLFGGDDSKRKKLVWSGIVWSVLYLGYAISNKMTVEQIVKQELDSKKISYSRLLTTPTPLNSWLWWVVVEDSGGFRVGFRSRFDSVTETELKYFQKNDSLVSDLKNEDVSNLKRFSEGFYTIEQRGDTLVFNDLRFGQNGWDNPSAPFVFHYYLNHPENNRMVMQRGRFSRWNKSTAKSFLDRIGGK